MITIVQASQYKEHREELASMFRLRKRVFHDRMQWPVTLVGDQERDKFDLLNPLYVIAKSADGSVCGSARLLPTTGPNMLSDVFSYMLPDHKPLRSPSVWESSRFSIEEPVEVARSETGVSRATAELLCGIIEAGISAGLEHIVSVVDVSVERVLKRAGCRCERIGSPGRMGRSVTVVGLFPMTNDLLTSVRRAGGISGTVIGSEPARITREVAA